MIATLPSRVGRRLVRQLTALLIFGGYLVVSSGCVNQPTNGTLSEAQLSLKEARRARSDPLIAAGDYLDAADAALRSTNHTSGETENEARQTYNEACQELAAFLRDHINSGTEPRPFSRRITSTNCALLANRVKPEPGTLATWISFELRGKYV
jgi:hypothetical protein